MKKSLRLLLVIGVALSLALTIPGATPGLAQGSDPGAPGPFAVSRQEYTFGDQAFTPTGFPQPVEMTASVHYPTNLTGGPFPLVVMLHGMHVTCFDPATNDVSLEWPCPAPKQSIPSYTGYDYVAEILASHGFIVVSVSANGINAQDQSISDLGPGMLARAELIQEHLNKWRTFNTTGGAPFGNLFVGKVDLTRVGTMGHSRGGEGVVQHFLLNQSQGSPFGIRAIFPVAPTDFHRFVINNIPLAVLLPYCDGDVIDLQGVHYFDDARYNVPGDTAGKHTILVMGAIHNFYNTTWTPSQFSAGASDDWLQDPFGNPIPGRSSDPHCGTVAGNGRLTDAQQRGTAIAYINAFFRVYVKGETTFLPVLTGDPPPSSAMTTEVFVSYHAPDNLTLRLDLNRELTASNLTTNFLGGAVSQNGLNPFELCGGDSPQPEHCFPSQSTDRQPHTTPSLFSNRRGLSQLHIGWDAASAQYINQLPAGSGDVSGYDWLQFRAAVDFSDARNPAAASQDFSMVLTDGAASAVSVRVGSQSNALYYPPGSTEPVPKVFLNMVRIPLSAFAGVNLTDIRSVEFRFDQTSTGALLISDMAFVSGQAVLPPPPPPTFPRLPICGDQDGSETPFIMRCPDPVWAGDVQLYQVPGAGQVTLLFDFVFREAGFNNELAFFRVDDALGTVDGLVPGDPGYVRAALTRAQTIFPSGSNAFTPDVTIQLNGGDLLVFVLVQNNTLANLRANNPDNLSNRSPLAFFSLNRLNPDGIDHFVGYQNSGRNVTQFGFEDLTGGGDRNFDDIVYNVTPQLQPLSGRIDLSPLNAERNVGDTHTLTVEVRNNQGNPVAGEVVVFDVTGANPTSGATTTNASGVATFSYQGNKAGTDTVVARTADLTSGTATVTWRSQCAAETAFGQSSSVSSPAHGLLLLQRVQQSVDALALLRRMRDEVLITTAQGQRYIDLYNIHTGEITTLLLADNALRNEGRATIEMFVPAFQAFVDGHGDEVGITADQVQAVQNFLNHLAAVGSPELASAIASELARRPLEPIAGMTMDEAWQYLNNLPPVADAGGPYDANEGDAVIVTASGSDPDGGPVTYAWDLNNDGTFETLGQSVTFSAAGLDGPSIHTVTVQVTDSGGLSAIDQATVNILNVSPAVEAIAAPPDPVALNTTINTSVSFTDPGVLDTHTGVWDWGDGATSPGSVSETNGSGSVTGSHTYTAAGVYTVKVTVADDDGDAGESIFQYVVVYDPDGGFVTGGGWINSPAGAYTPDASLTGKASFGFVSKYQKGATVPTGQTEFQFRVANLNFHSSSYQWLVVAGAKAQYKGSGTINGSGDYGFILTAIDGQVNGGGGADKFRIKIWDKGTGDVIYDNQLGAADTDGLTTAIAGGSIVIHK